MSESRGRLVHVDLRSVLPKGGTLPDDVWRYRHRAILVVLWAHVPALFLFAVFRGYSWTHALAEAGLVSIPAVIAVLAENRRALSTLAASVGLMTASAVLVHLAGGQTEAHFHFFVMVGVVVLYQEWTPYLVAIGFVVLHHSVFGSLHPQDVYGHEAARSHPVTWAVIHGVAILAMSAAGIANWKINEKHQSELGQLNASLGATLESTGDGILVVDLAGRITSSNARFADMYRLPESVLATHDDHAVIAYVADQLLDSTGYLASTSQLYADPDAERTDVLLFKDGREIERFSKPQRVAGTIVGRVFSFHDVTNRVRLEGELEEALRKALESSRLKSEFLATMSHEIRTPMNGIIGLTGLLMDMELGETEREYVEGVHVSGEALLGIVNDVLDFSKIEAGMLRIESVDFDVVKAVDEVAALIALPARHKNLEFTITRGETTATRLRGDVGRLRQILLNLLSNAVKFTPSGGVVLRFSTGPLSDASFASTGGVLLRVDIEDTGIGIARRRRAALRTVHAG